MAEKKFFVDINLQGNKLVNPVVGSNSSMTAEGSFQYNAGRLEYYNGSTVQEVANLNDIAAVTGGLILQGGYDAATNTPDIAADSSVLKGFFWVVTAAGSFLGEAVQVGDSIIAKQDNPGATAANWLILQGNVVIATDSVDGISRLATQTEANDGTEGGAVVITPATLQGKIDDQITPEINNKLPLAGGTMSGAINMGGNNITAVGNGTFDYVYTDRIAEKPGSSDIKVDISLDFQNSSQAKNLPAPTDGGDAANKTYVDDNTSNKLPLAGGTMSGSIDMGGNSVGNVDYVNTDHLSSNLGSSIIFDGPLDGNNASTIINLPAPTNGGDATNKTYVDDQDALKVSKAGDTMSGNLDMGANQITNTIQVNASTIVTDAIDALTGPIYMYGAFDYSNYNGIINLGTPVDGGDAANKTYVDDAASTAQSNAESFATSAANTAESNANAYTDTAIASTNKSATLFGSSSGSSSWNLVNYNDVPTYMASVDDNFNTQHKSVTTTIDNIIVEFTVVVFPNTTYIYSNIEPSSDTLITILR